MLKALIFTLYLRCIYNKRSVQNKTIKYCYLPDENRTCIYQFSQLISHFNLVNKQDWITFSKYDFIQIIYYDHFKIKHIYVYLRRRIPFYSVILFIIACYFYIVSRQEETRFTRSKNALSLFTIYQK